MLKNLEGGGRNLLRLIFWNWSGHSEENYEEHQSGFEAGTSRIQDYITVLKGRRERERERNLLNCTKRRIMGMEG
jgi:hypothetical protein